jgi:hypothetical protein
MVMTHGRALCVVTALFMTIGCAAVCHAHFKRTQNPFR